ncbi:MAG: leucyl/phenylalanyl-tRNA--protein transferase [Thalassotalea sp.]|nr:leucyl/phenylalanyl-tRNA--protein transferase [Thalassotalea sp.]
MKQILVNLTDEDLSFPNPHTALTEPNGLLAVGGDLQIQRLINAYTQGIFPWFSEDDPYLWWSPDPRTIINVDEININRTLKKFLKKSPYTVSINKAFSQVIALCADAPFRNDDTWILDDMLIAYTDLHHAGFAHSIEVWQDEKLVGGLYGVAINGLFSGESMFYLKDNASKVALLALSDLLKQQGISFIDCQLQNPFLQAMGAIEIPRTVFLNRKNAELKIQLPTDFWQARTLQADE